MTRFFHGTSLLFKGWTFLRRNPSLWIWVLIPWIIDLTVLILGWIWGVAGLKSLLATALASWTAGGWVMDLLYYPLLIILGIGFLVLWLVAVLAVASVVAAPFHAILAEKALRKQGLSVIDHQSLGSWLRHALKMLLSSLAKLTIFLLAGLFLFSVSFIPGLNLVAGYFSMCLFAADVFDYTFEAKGISFSKRVKEWRRFQPEVMGLGVTLSLTSIIPGLTVFCLPVALLGATTVLAQAEKV